MNTTLMKHQIFDLPHSAALPELIDSKKKEVNQSTDTHSFDQSHEIPETSNAFHSFAVSQGGPTEHCCDMLGAPAHKEKCNSGAKNIEENCISASQCSTIKDEYPPEAYLMVTQRQWEDCVIWDGDTIKDEVLKNMYHKNNPAGWTPAKHHRTWFAYNKYAKFMNSSETTANSQKQQFKKCIESDYTSNEDETPWSLLPIDSEKLVYGRWEDDVIWDNESISKILKPRIFTLDPNDENLVLGIPDDSDAPSSVTDEPEISKECIVRKSRVLLEKAGLISGSEPSCLPRQENVIKDPFNISNDEYYTPKMLEDSILSPKFSGNYIQHSIPAIELHTSIFPTYLSPRKLKNFHRPSFKIHSRGDSAMSSFHGIMSVQKHAKQNLKCREENCQSVNTNGDVNTFFMRNIEDLSGKDGEVILAEYSEEHAPLLMQVGMATKIKNFYKRKPGKNRNELAYKYGEKSYAHTTPFLGSLSPGQSIQALENNLFRAPIYKHDFPNTDFLLIQAQDQYYIRDVEDIFTVGQELPLLEVPSPNSKKANNCIRDFLHAFIYRLFWKSKDRPRRIKMEVVKKAFPTYSESNIRKRLKLYADFKRVATGSNWWVLKTGCRLPSEDEIRSLLSPEQCCAYYSMLAGKQRLKDAGYGEKSIFSPDDDNDLKSHLKLDDEVKTAPWNSTKAFFAAAKGQCFLQLTGVADPTGCGEGFSYVKMPSKFHLTDDEFEAQIRKKRVLTGTDADLRRLSLNKARQLLRRFDIPESEIKDLSRWEIIDAVRTLSTEQTKVGEKEMSKFARGNRFSITEQQEKYREECQRIFNLQNRILSSKEIISTDEELSSEDDSEIETMGKNIESMLFNKKTNFKFLQEREEIERKELQKLVMSENISDTNFENETKVNFKEKNKMAPSKISRNVAYANRILKIYRTFLTVEGKEYVRVETVRNPAIIEGYVKIRTTKDPILINKFSTLSREKQKEICKSRKRIQGQLKKLKRCEKARENTSQDETLKKDKLLLNVKCSACKKMGHMKTNRSCSHYGIPIPPVEVAMTKEEEEKSICLKEDNWVTIDDTKLVVSKQLIRQIDEVRRKSLILKIPKTVLLSNKKQKKIHLNTECDSPRKRTKMANRQRTDPFVTITTMFENLLSNLRSIPDSQPFWFPVNRKKIPCYYEIIKTPMDLHTMRKKLQQKDYRSREEFLKDVYQIVENSTLFNGANSIFTLTAQKMLEFCLKNFSKNEEKLMQLENAITDVFYENNQESVNSFDVMPQNELEYHNDCKRPCEFGDDAEEHNMDIVFPRKEIENNQFFNLENEDIVNE